VLSQAFVKNAELALIPIGRSSGRGRAPSPHTRSIRWRRNEALDDDRAGYIERPDEIAK